MFLFNYFKEEIMKQLMNKFLVVIFSLTLTINALGQRVMDMTQTLSEVAQQNYNRL